MQRSSYHSDSTPVTLPLSVFLMPTFYALDAQRISQTAGCGPMSAQKWLRSTLKNWRLIDKWNNLNNPFSKAWPVLVCHSSKAWHFHSTPNYMLASPVVKGWMCACMHDVLSSGIACWQSSQLTYRGSNLQRLLHVSLPLSANRVEESFGPYDNWRGLGNREAQ